MEEKEIVLDARAMRGIAHPLRVRLLSELRLHGPSTATRLAERVGQSSGATSYHLRQLAAYGFVEEDRTGAGGRERWWRARHSSTRIRMAELDHETAELAGGMLRQVVTLNAEAALRAVDELPALEPAWRGATAFVDGFAELTAEETAQLKKELYAVLSRYRERSEARKDAPPADARQVLAVLQLFRRPA